MDISCEECANFVFDDDSEDWVCLVNMDEDDMARMMQAGRDECPFYRNGDEYAVVKHQAF